MTRVILVRHGETDLNRSKVFRGQLDAPLNDNGKRQAESLAQRLADQKIDAVYSSPLSRARETAETVAEFHDLPVNVVEGLTDISYGDWQGVSDEDVHRQYPQLHQDWQTVPHGVTFPNGESLAQVRRRVSRAVNALLKKNEGKTILLSCHRVVNKVLLCLVLGKANSFFWNIKQDNCCLNIFSKNSSGYVIELLNDINHLKDLDVLQFDF